MNPYPDYRATTCPECGHATGQRKLPLMVHVHPSHFLVLNYTCRYCRRCDMLIAHKHEVEHLLSELFLRMDPDVIGNEYLILGTMEKAAWREGIKQPTTLTEGLTRAHDFKQYFSELRTTLGGWYPADQEPPIRQPPPSQEWVKGPTDGNPMKN